MPLSTGGDEILVLTSGGSTTHPGVPKGAGSGPQRCFASGGPIFGRPKMGEKSASPLRAGPRCCPIGHDQG